MWAMNFDAALSLFFIISVIVPGFVYHGIISNCLPRRQWRSGQIFLSLLTPMAFNYAICSPLLYLLVFSPNFFGHLRLKALVWFAVVFIVPVILAIINARIVQKDGLVWLFRLIGLSTIRPIPGEWDRIFNTTEPCYVLITLKDGTKVAGYLGTRSIALSEPVRKDIYIGGRKPLERG
jgi:Family of unknown function (DUF6338)